MTNFKCVRTPDAWCEGNDRRRNISPVVLELVDMGKITRGLESVIQLESPAVGDGLAKEAFEIFRG